jgi:hypothetical protein
MHVCTDSSMCVWTTTKISWCTVPPARIQDEDVITPLKAKLDEFGQLLSKVSMPSKQCTVSCVFWTYSVCAAAWLTGIQGGCRGAI